MKIVTKNVMKNVMSIVRKGVISSTKIPFLIHKVQKLCNEMEKLSSWDMSQNQIPFHYNFHYIFYYIFFSCESGPCSAAGKKPEKMADIMYTCPA